MRRRRQSRYLWHYISRIPTGNENCKSISPRATDTVECGFCHNRTTAIGQKFDGFDDCRTCLEAMVPPYNVSKIYRSQFLWHVKKPCTRLRTISFMHYIPDASDVGVWILTDCESLYTSRNQRNNLIQIINTTNVQSNHTTNRYIQSSSLL